MMFGSVTISRCSVRAQYCNLGCIWNPRFLLSIVTWARARLGPFVRISEARLHTKARSSRLFLDKRKQFPIPSHTTHCILPTWRTKIPNRHLEAASPSAATTTTRIHLSLAQSTATESQRHPPCPPRQAAASSAVEEARLLVDYSVAERRLEAAATQAAAHPNPQRRRLAAASS